MAGNQGRRHRSAANQFPPSFNDGTPLFGDKSTSYGLLLAGCLWFEVSDDGLGWDDLAGP